MTDLTHLPVFGPEHANCSTCELRHQCAAKKVVTAWRPAHWNGIVIVGEGPGVVEVSRGRPFVGAAGAMLKALLEVAGVELDDCYITQATLCLPPRDSNDAASFMERFPGAVHACQARLRAELVALQPRVVLALGATAFAAIAGVESHRTRRVPTNCDMCDPVDRKIGPALACAVADCGWLERCALDDEKRLKEAYGGKCPKCAASIKRIKVKRVKCPACGGTKTHEEPYTTFISDWRLNEVAGGLFSRETLPQLDGFGVKYLIPTYHPSFLLRATDSQSGSKKFGGQFAARAVTDHFRRAVRFLDRDPAFALEIEITDSPARVREYTSGPGPFVVDIETNSEEGPFGVTQIRCVGIYDTSTSLALVVDTELCEKCAGGDVVPLVGALTGFLEDETKRKILQHGIYDRVTMRLFWAIEVRGQEADTELAHQALYPDEPHNLAHIAALMTDAEAWKPPKKKGGTLVFESFESLAIYNARDLKVTGDASLVMGADARAAHGLLDQEKVRAPYAQDMRLLDIAEEMEVVGLPVDAAALAQIGDAAREEIKVALEKMGQAFVAGGVAERVEVYPTGLPDDEPDEPAPVEGDENEDEDAVPPARRRAAIVLRNDGRKLDPFVWRPTVPKDLLWALFDKPGFLELPVLMRTQKTQAPATSKDALIAHVGEKTGFVQALFDWRKSQKILSTYVEGDGLDIKPDGRIHATWNVARAVTGRWSTSPNLQNWPRDLRAAIVAGPGRKLVGADYAQLELRILAALSGDPDLIRRCMEADEDRKLEPEWDPHSFVASLTFGETFTALNLNDPAHRKTKPGEPKCRCETCKRKALREVVKRTVYGMAYGSSPPTIRDAIYNGGYEGPPITVAIIERVQQRFFAAFSCVNVWRNDQLARVERDWEVRSPLLGRRRIFPLGRTEFTIAVNYPIQSCGADIVNAGTIRYYDGLRSIDPTARVIAQVHDALYTDCAEDKAEAVAAWKTQALSVHLALVEGAPPMAFLASAKIGQSWKEVS